MHQVQHDSTRGTANRGGWTGDAPLSSSLLRAPTPCSLDAARADDGVRPWPWLGPVRLWKISEEEAGRSAQAHAANPGATLAGATTICSLQPTSALSNKHYAYRPRETTSRTTARDPDDTAAHHMAFRSYIFWRSLVENRDNQATEPCSVNHGDMAHLPKGRLRRRASTGKTLTVVGDPETRAHGCCLKSVTRVSVDGKSA